ncbi:hypothetical protein EDD15DRAFT_1019072 [Pisolithus albus]|nr:hypothetical protein EDD15DRAFT_1019072 [Pisolithus albus]
MLIHFSNLFQQKKYGRRPSQNISQSESRGYDFSCPSRFSPLACLHPSWPPQLYPRQPMLHLRLMTSNQAYLHVSFSFCSRACSKHLNVFARCLPQKMYVSWAKESSLYARASAEKGARTSEDVSILNGKTTAKGEGEDEQTITLEIGKNDHLIVGDVVAVSPVAESFEGNDERGRSRRVSRR